LWRNVLLAMRVADAAEQLAYFGRISADLSPIVPVP